MSGIPRAGPLPVFNGWGGALGGGRRSQLANFRPQKLPPIPYLLSNMIQARKPYKVPEEEAEVMSDREIASEPDPMVKKYAVRPHLSH